MRASAYQTLVSQHITARGLLDQAHLQHAGYRKEEGRHGA